MRQANVPLLALPKVRRQHDAARRPGPVGRVQRGVVLGQVGVAGVAEDALDEIEVGDAAPRDEEADLQALLGRDARYLGADEGAELQRDHGLNGLGPFDGVGELVERGGRLEGDLEQPLVGNERNLDLVGRNGQAAVGDVKDAFGGALVHERVVQDAALVQAVAGNLAVEELGLAHWEAEFLQGKEK